MDDGSWFHASGPAYENDRFPVRSRAVSDCWRSGVVVTELGVSTKLLYVEPG